MAYTLTEWEALQRRLPPEDRTSYDEYLTSIGRMAPAPSRLASQESGAIGAASIASQLTPETTARIAASNVSTTQAPSENPPTTGLKAGYEWYKFNLPGGGFEWRQKPTRETLAGAYTTLFSGGGSQMGGGLNISGSTGSTGGANVPNPSTGGLTATQKQSQSAFEIFRGFLRQFGIEGLAADVEKYKLDGLSDEELLIRLRTESTAYKNRFKANETRIAKGLRSLSEAEYILQEDKYQDIMRRYGLPESYYTRGAMGRQEGFEKLIGNDVSSIELEDRIQTAQNRVINAAPEIGQALREFYPDITNGDILAYALDPDKAIENIKRKVTAAEIQGAATMAGLNILGPNATPEQIAAARARATELGTYGVTGAQAREGFQNVATVLPRASMLGDIYAKQGLGEYTQTTAEQEVFGLTGSAEAERKRRKLSELEQAQFAGSAGAAQGALARERAGSF